jgi:hypothetical protein
MSKETKNTDPRWVDAVVKLIKLTQNGKLKWQVNDPSQVEKVDGEDIITEDFVAKYRDRLLRVYKRRRPPTPVERAMLGVESKVQWYTHYGLEFVTAANQTLWAFPREAPIRDLHKAVQYQVARVNDFLDEILNEDT